MLRHCMTKISVQRNLNISFGAIRDLLSLQWLSRDICQKLPQSHQHLQEGCQKLPRPLPEVTSCMRLSVTVTSCKRLLRQLQIGFLRVPKAASSSQRLLLGFQRLQRQLTKEASHGDTRQESQRWRHLG